MSSAQPLVRPEAESLIPTGTDVAATATYNLDDVLAAADEAQLNKANRVNQFSFVIDDITYYVSHSNDGTDQARICIQAILGFMPYSIEGDDRRAALQMILSTAHKLKHVRLGQDHTGRLYAAAIFSVGELRAPDFIFWPLVQFLQEATPFINLIGTYL